MTKGGVECAAAGREAKNQRSPRFVWNDPCCASLLPIPPEQG